MGHIRNSRTDFESSRGKKNCEIILYFTGEEMETASEQRRTTFML